MLLIPGHRFGHPTVQYSRGEVLNEASWNLKGKQFYRHQRKSFRFLTLVENGIHGQKLTKGLNTFEVFATNNYAVINRQSTRKVWLNDPKDPLAIERAITAYTSDVGAAPELVLLVLKVRSVEAYSRFKDVVDRTTGCHSICMTERVFEGGIASCMRNIMMKANLKGAGSNHTIKDGIIQQIMSDTLVLGADVTHPSGSSILGCPSIAAIVGSVDDHAGRFLGSMRLQSAAKKEVIPLETRTDPVADLDR
jgi:eukaryotic translation initiation factor 2C